jgi:hypothetical protein
VQAAGGGFPCATNLPDCVHVTLPRSSCRAPGPARSARATRTLRCGRSSDIEQCPQAVRPATFHSSPVALLGPVPELVVDTHSDPGVVRLGGGVRYPGVPGWPVGIAGREPAAGRPKPGSRPEAAVPLSGTAAPQVHHRRGSQWAVTLACAAVSKKLSIPVAPRARGSIQNVGVIVRPRLFRP